ncbi:unnamed protein product [Pocillopora meandrina]|uniref:Uncharacterized protein n=1 Tax=Pocillopora meandrina TaxID=46732 RepID=A0AAU9XH42_9CNID|nr:unnamed protein product [Pocillopora meandrina]
MERPARNVILKYVAFFEEHIMFVSDIFDRGTYIHDYGSKKETVYLDETKVNLVSILQKSLKPFCLNLKSGGKKNKMRWKQHSLS